MSSAGFGWESLIGTDAPREAVLKAALFTTYDRPDGRLLAEHLLPQLLRLEHEPDGEGRERQLFLLELDHRLKQLRDRIVVVSSGVHGGRSDGGTDDGDAYERIWRFIRHVTVGHRARAVQHAKLWLLHWSAPDDEGAESLEIVVSSSNLTRAAFKDQLQAAWRGRIPLSPQRSEARLRSWGVLPAFLRELAASSGDDARLDLYVELLARADCPDGVSFVASVPGSHPREVLRRTPWGSRGLREAAPAGAGAVSTSILAPFVGSWTVDRLRRWCESFGGSPARTELVWIDRLHPWAANWILPKKTLASLREAGATLLHLRHSPDPSDAGARFHEAHHPADLRWSHAKVYALRRGASRRLLVTSANFSTAAWGRESADGTLEIENFELGVCVTQGAWPFEGLEAFETFDEIATVSHDAAREHPTIAWAEASWDGARVSVKCRCEATSALAGVVEGGGAAVTIARWKTEEGTRLRAATVGWRDAAVPPESVSLTCGEESLRIDVFDARPGDEIEEEAPHDVDEEDASALRDALLFEQYGGPVVPDDEPPATDDGDAGEEDAAEDAEDGSDDESEEGEPADEDAGGTAGIEGAVGEQGSGDSYAVPAFARARRMLGIVDNWASALRRIATKPQAELEREWLRRDGHRLVAAFRRQEHRDSKIDAAHPIGARLAAEELELRLAHFPEAG